MLGNFLKSKKLTIGIVLLIVITSVSIAFAAIQTTLQINGTATMQTASWNIKFASLSSPTLVGNATVDTAPTLSNTSIGTYKVILTKPGDSVSYTFDVVNSGDLDAEIGTFTKAATPTCTGVSAVPTDATADATLICNGLTYTLTYTTGGATVALGDTLAAGATKNMKLTLAYNGEDLPTDDVDITGLAITMIYVEDK